MDHPYGASEEKSTFYHMPEFQKPTAHYRSKIGIRSGSVSYGFALKKILSSKKFEKIKLLFTKPKSSLAELWSPTTPKFARVCKPNF